VEWFWRQFPAARAGRVFKGSKYGIQGRTQAAIACLIYGNVTKASEATGFPQTTIRYWRKEEWWSPLCDEVRAEKEHEFQAGFARIVEAAIGQVEDRLRDGDVKLVRAGNGHEERRVPVSAKDATIVAAVSYDKLRLSLNLPTSIWANTDASSLESLAIRFGEIGRAYQREVIDINPMTGEVIKPSGS